MFKTILVNLEADATRASVELGRRSLGELPPKDVLVLLERFRMLDQLQNFEADPEIILETRRRKRVVRVNVGNLCLYDPSNILASAHVLSPEEIIAELDRTAAVPVRHSAADTEDFLANLRRKRTVPRPVLPLRPGPRAGLAAAAILLAGYLAYAYLATTPAAGASFAPLAAGGEYDALQENLVGVYMTGNQPGDHGIVLDTGGALKIFELTAQGAPSLIRDTYRLGRIGGPVCALCTQPGGPIWIKGRDSVEYCGETYKRLP